MFKIKNFSELTGLTVRTLQYYDEIELLTPTRDNNGHRMYTTEDLITINEIILMKNMGLSLENITTQVNNKENKSLEDSLIRQEALLKRQVDDIQNQLHQIRKLIQSYDEHKTIEDEAIRQVFIEKNPFKDKINDIWNLDFSELQILDYLKNYNKEINFDKYFQQLAKLQTVSYKDHRVQKIIAEFVQVLFESYGNSLNNQGISEIALLYRNNQQAKEYLSKYGENFNEFLSEALRYFVKKENYLE